MKEIYYSYIAGIIDGEGCIIINKDKNVRVGNRNEYNYTPRIQVQMSDVEALKFMQKILGGKISQQDYPYYKSILYSLVYRSYSDCKRIIKKLFPHLKIKKKQAKLLLEYIKFREQNLQKYTGKENEYWMRMKELNKSNGKLYHNKKKK